MSHTDVHTRPQHIPELEQYRMYTSEYPDTLADADIANLDNPLFSRARQRAVMDGPSDVRSGQVVYIGQVTFHFTEFDNPSHGQYQLSAGDVLTVPMMSEGFLTNELRPLVLTAANMGGVPGYGVDETITHCVDQFRADYIQRITDTSRKNQKPYFERLYVPRTVVATRDGAPGVAGLLSNQKKVLPNGNALVSGRAHFFVTYDVFVGPSYRQSTADLIDKSNDQRDAYWHHAEPDHVWLERNRHYPRKRKDYGDDYGPNPVKQARARKRVMNRNAVKLSRRNIPDPDEWDDYDFA